MSAQKLSPYLSTWTCLSILSLLVLTSCATAYDPPPLSTQHPAHPQAMATPLLPRSNTLAYAPADIPAPQPGMQMAQQERHGAHGMPGAQPSTHESQHTVVGEGKVIAVVPSSNQIVLDHKAIEGFMDAMTMGYQVESPSLFEGVQAGDAVRFTIDPQRKTITKLEKMP